MRHPNNLAASGISSIGRNSGGVMHLWSRITQGLKAAEGRSVLMTLSLKDQAWLLSNMALEHPDVFRKIVAELGDHKRPPKYSGHDFAMAKRLDNAAHEALKEEFSEQSRGT